jgi:glycosyltransferase involved in cell wall biosynthesis|tara:strand:+ start:1692 stop:2366 length:675 start_codon:yes stop_codon:yes gene_type:complete
MIQFIFPYRKDSSSREKNLDKVLNFYTEKFPNEKFLVVEVGDEKTYKGNISSIFEKQSLPHNQAKTINIGIEKSTEDVLCIVDSDIILLEYENIKTAARMIYHETYDYILPYLHCYDLPSFERRDGNHLMGGVDGKCIGGIWMVSKKVFTNLGKMNTKYEGWGAEDDYRHWLLSNNVSWRRLGGTILHLYHPPQKQIEKYSRINKQHLNNDISNFNKIQETKFI